MIQRECSPSCSRHQSSEDRLRLSPRCSRGLAISTCLFLCHSYLSDLMPHQVSLLSTTPLHRSTTNIFAEAWVPPRHPSPSTTKHAMPTRIGPSPLAKFRQSKITRWYVHDDDTKIPNGETIPSLSTNHQNAIINGEQNEPSSIHYQPKQQLDLKILLIDNHDSYTYNLYQYLSTMTAHPVKVIMNDVFSSWDDFLESIDSDSNSPDAATTTLDHFDCIVLSPGPGQPSHPADIGIVLETIRRNANVPILGVCLGHQALGYVYGKEVKLSPCGPVHGLMSSVSYREETSVTGKKEERLTCELFRDLPQNCDVVRYHSLVVDFPKDILDDDSEIEPIAWCNSLKETPPPDLTSPESSLLQTSDKTNICMGLRHKHYPHYGVQFHPESVGTGEAGYQLLWNFCEFAHRYKVQRRNEKIEKESSIEIAQQSKGEIAEAVVNGNRLTANEPKQMNGVQNEIVDTPLQSKYRVLIHKVGKGKQTKSSLPLPKEVFESMYSSHPNSFWLDSSTAEARFPRDGARSDDKEEEEGCPISSNSRFSIMGSNDGPLSRKIEYFGREHNPKRRGLRVTTSSGVVEEEVIPEENILSYLRQKLVEEREIVDRADMVTFGGLPNANGASVPDYTLRTINEFGDGASQMASGDEVPFEYRGGYVGFLGYEVRHDTECRIIEQEGGHGCDADYNESWLNGQSSSDTKTNPNVPTAAFLFADRSLLYDHQTGDWYIIGVTENANIHGMADTDCPAGAGVDGTLSWVQSMTSKLESIGKDNTTNNASVPINGEAKCEADDNVTFIPNRSKAQYQMDISRSHDEIRNGESYELCVTNQLEAKIMLPKHSMKSNYESPFELYKMLREKNPAPFSAFMNFYDNDEEASRTARSSSLSICCSSPERFLSVKKDGILQNKVNGSTNVNQTDRNRHFIVESKPIKGTAARYRGVNGSGASDGKEQGDDELVKRIDSQIAEELQKSVKDRAENLMIVDLLRNDLGRVCQVGSVHVPKLMHIESYATVHQMVSTIRGTLEGGDGPAKKNAIDVIEACFPGGSMTGAPKQRSMEILDEIEEGVSRGPYSGCLGYISLNGCMDMNIVIRSAIFTPVIENEVGGEIETETWKASIGCGGAITALSNSDDEYEEMLLKSRVVRKTISDWVTQATAERTEQQIRHVDSRAVR